jgi:hypothetical protein
LSLSAPRGRRGTDETRARGTGRGQRALLEYGFAG